MARAFVFDKSPRTKAISRPFWVVALAFIISAACIVAMAAGCRHDSKLKSNSSTPIGSTLTFSVSGAKMKFSNLYTDANDDVMIARLALDDAAHEVLPYRGSDYTVFVKSKATEQYKEIPILFGKMGTDGDMFLILPKPAETVYSFAIVNPSGVPQDDKSLGAGPGGLDEDNARKSVTSALSELDEQLANDPSGESTDQKKSEAATKFDMTQFRMTTHPWSDEPQYQPQRIDADLYNPQTKQFDFKKFFQRVYIDTAVEQLTTRYNDQTSRIDQARDSIDKLNVRLRANPDDVAASSNLRDYQSTLDKLEKSQEQIVSDLTRYQNLKYDPNIFSDFQNKAVVIND